ncbi:hypothetical protein pb186bvf_017994 [Paramecium bursaria]
MKITENYISINLRLNSLSYIKQLSIIDKSIFNLLIFHGIQKIHEIYNHIEDDPKEPLCINNESDYVQQEQESKQNYNYPPQQYVQEQYQQYQQYSNQPQQQSYQQYPIINPIQNQQIQQPIVPPQYQTVHDVPLLVQINDENSQLLNVGQKRSFAVTVVTLWMFQIIIEVTIVIKKGIYLLPGFLYPCFFIALLIMLYTLYDNYPINQMKKVRLIDQLLFIIYFLADIFVIFLLLFTINEDGIDYILVITRTCQGSNLLCALIPILRTEKKISTKEILLLTLVPFGFMIIVSVLMSQWFRASPIIYIIPIAQQILQICETFNLVRVINEIYSKENTKIDVNNIYTGFILFKYSYYIPF